MKKNLFLLACINSVPLVSKSTQLEKKAELLVERCYKNKGLSAVDELTIEQLIASLEALPPLEQARVATLAHKELKKVTQQLQKNLHDKKVRAAEKKRITYELFLVSVQEKHLERFSTLTLQKEPGYKKGDLWISTTFGPTKESTTKIVQQLVAYTKLERHKLLATPQTAISFFYAQNNASLPKVMRFWWFKPEQQQVIKMARATTSCLNACSAALVDVAETAEALDVVGDIGVEGVAGEEATENAALAAQLEKDTQTFIDPVQAETAINQTLNDAITNMADSVDPLASLGRATDATQLAGQPLQSLTKMSAASDQALTDLDTTSESVTEKIQSEITTQQTTLDALKGVYNKGLGGTVDSIMETSANRIQDGLEWLTKKYPNSTALKSLSQGFQSTRALYGGVSSLIGKFGPLGVIKWLETSETGKVIYSMLKLSIVMSGSSMFNAWINQQTFAAYAKLSAFKVQLANAMQDNVTRIQAAFAVKNAQLTNAFQTSFAQLNSAQATLQLKSTKDITYLNNALSETVPQQLYMSEPMYNDQLFLLSTMLTPQQQANSSAANTTSNSSTWKTGSQLNFKQQAEGSWAGPLVAQKKQIIAQATGTTTSAQTPVPSSVTLESIITTLPQQNPAYPAWYNIFRQGNWEFEVNEVNGAYQGSFVQQSVVPLIDDNSSTPLFLQALYNSIFTQYIPPAFYYGLTETHVIQVACTLTKVSYPFFMGIDVNAGRWLSGVDQLRYQRRTLGVLGLEQAQSTVWFGETFYLQPQQALQAQVNAVWPLWQFFESSTYASTWSAANPNAVIATKPLYTDNTKNPLIVPGVTLIFTIATQPTQVTLSVQVAGSEEPFIDNVVITNLNPKLFIYHNIGLIAAGCSASFTVLHPQALTYPQASLKTFLQEVQS